MTKTRLLFLPTLASIGTLMTTAVAHAQDATSPVQTKLANASVTADMFSAQNVIIGALIVYVGWKFFKRAFS